ncbi:MAG TPA: nodulation protein NfeD [Persephonella sp.]|uniref:Nodulation competitiveness protein NfeD n=1 Tax=Persephonella marina (strain DSM 14350 / EX-H1) TaxID=123214 RepID=C0QT88_PERMH|nr:MULTISPECIES: nodulation protein NfeD [Persephonella]ACO04011.1 nodulation competitiveness protein NfeD [Persephonella marina EX-H1]HCB70478.1 nodulation protein NfeD [Persephonella sp.]
MRYIIAFILFLFSLSPAGVVTGQWNAPVTPVMSDYVKRVIHKAEVEKADAVIIMIDTPGGLDTSMREIIKTIMNSSVPVVVYVYPPGSRAASAGAIITVSADIAAMSPSTNIGSASPVQMGGKDIEETMKKKIINDMVAFVKGIAKEKGRNEKIIVKMVTESINLTAEEALKKNVIDIIATDLDDLLNKIEGRTVKKHGKEIKISLKDKKIVKVEKSLKEKILTILTNPTVAYLLLMIGFYGIFFELYNPGSLIPGILGTISLLLALYSLNIIDVNWLGVLLIAAGVLFFILEVITPTFGALALSGVIAILFGSLILTDPDSPYGDISLKIIIPVVAFSALFFLTVAYLGLKAQRRKTETGMEGMIGMIGKAETDIDPEGKVFIAGEIWNAYSEEPIKKGENVKVVSVKGLRLKVERTEGET